MATLHVFPAQARGAGTVTSASATYNGGSVNCTLNVVDANWATEPTTLDVHIEGQESFDNGATWRSAIGPYDFNPPHVDKNGNPPSAGFSAQNDGAGARLVRAVLTLNQAWSGGIDLTIA